MTSQDLAKAPGTLDLIIGSMTENKKQKAQCQVPGPLGPVASTPGAANPLDLTIMSFNL